MTTADASSALNMLSMNTNPFLSRLRTTLDVMIRSLASQALWMAGCPRRRDAVPSRYASASTTVADKITEPTATVSKVSSRRKAIVYNIQIVVRLDRERDDGWEENENSCSPKNTAGVGRSDSQCPVCPYSKIRKWTKQSRYPES